MYVTKYFFSCHLPYIDQDKCQTQMLYLLLANVVGRYLIVPRTYNLCDNGIYLKCIFLWSLNKVHKLLCMLIFFTLLLYTLSSRVLPMFYLLNVMSVCVKFAQYLYIVRCYIMMTIAHVRRHAESYLPIMMLSFSKSNLIQISQNNKNYVIWNAYRVSQCDF